MYFTNGGDAGESIQGFAVRSNFSGSLGVLVNQNASSPNFSAASLNGHYSAATVEDPEQINGYSGLSTACLTEPAPSTRRTTLRPRPPQR